MTQSPFAANVQQVRSESRAAEWELHFELELKWEGEHAAGPET